MDEKKPITIEILRNFWPVAAILFGLGMTWASLNSKIETLIVAQKETNDIAKNLAVIVSEHDTDIAVLENQMSACYNACVSPSRVSNTRETATASFPANAPSNTSQKPNEVNVKSESQSSSQNPKEDESDVKASLPILGPVEVKL